MRKGEHGELVVYADRITRTETNDKGEDVERAIPFLKGYTVFNAEQCENLPAHYTAKIETPALPIAQRIEAADRFFAATGAEIRHGGNRAYYAEGADFVQMPPFETFRDAESYAATLAHECMHWTKHEQAPGAGFRAHALRRRRLCEGRTGCRARKCFPLCRSRDHAGNSRRSRRLHRDLVGRAEERQAPHLHGRQPRAARGRLSARPAGCIRRCSDRARGGGRIGRRFP